MRRYNAKLSLKIALSIDHSANVIRQPSALCMGLPVYLVTSLLNNLPNQHQYILLEEETNAVVGIRMQRRGCLVDH